MVIKHIYNASYHTKSDAVFWGTLWGHIPVRTNFEIESFLTSLLIFNFPSATENQLFNTWNHPTSKKLTLPDHPATS